MSTARHRADPSPAGRFEDGLPISTTPNASPAATALARVHDGRGFRRRITTASALVAVAGLSLTMLVPANASTLPASRATRHVTARSITPQDQAYAVPASVSVEPSVARDGFTATSLAAWNARQLAARTVAQTKSAAIDAILGTPVSVVTVTPIAAAASTSTVPTGAALTPAAATGAPGTTTSPPSTTVAARGDGPGVTVTTSGTVADRVSRATLEKASARDDEIVQTAVQYVGLVPYVHDGADPKTGFDCSGLVLYVFARFGISVPHDVDGIAALGKPVAADRLQPGDLVVYAHQHIGIYLGDGYMVDAPNVGRDVEVQQVWGSPTYVRLPAS